MFNNETKTVEKFGQNIVTTIKMGIGDKGYLSLVQTMRLLYK